MYKNVAKAAKKSGKPKTGQTAKKAMLKDQMRRVRKENIMDRGPITQLGKRTSLNKT